MTSIDQPLVADRVASSRRGPGRRASELSAAPWWSSLQSSRWLMGFVVFEFLCQLALLIPTLSVLRVGVRVAAFAGSAAMFLMPGKGADFHPARNAVLVCLGILAISTFHPDTANLTAGIATVLLSLCIAGPLFWSARIRLDALALRKLFLLVWAFQSASATLGVLQVYFPGRFDPVTSIILNEGALNGLRITLADGTRVFRPMGLTDTPGGAAVGGMYSVLFAIALWLERPRFLFRIVLLLSMGVGLFALYLCQVRSLLVMLIPAFIAAAWSQMSVAKPGQVVKMIAPLALTAIVAFVFAASVGGDSMTARLATLIADDPQTVFMSNRGFFLQHTFSEMIPDYPLGAGLGRWGMIASYFGGGNPSATPIWAEVQWTAWLVDGGVPLMLGWATALAIAFHQAFRVAVSKDASLRGIAVWAGILVGYDMGVIAVTFNGCPFAGTMGVDFWLLNGAIFAAAAQARRSAGETPATTSRIGARNGPMARVAEQGRRVIDIA